MPNACKKEDTSFAMKCFNKGFAYDLKGEPCP